MNLKNRHLVAAALALAVGAAPAAAQPMRTLDAGGGLYLNQIGPRASLREPDGRVSELVLPPGTQLRRLEHLGEAWFAAGEVDIDDVTDLLLLRGDAAARGPFPAPPNAAGHRLRAGPMPLVEAGRLVGLAWLAGPRLRQAAVYAARWDGSAWSPPELVSPVGPGTQIAIDGVVLADGSWLLVWSAYDGSDDEILWSRRVGQRWTEPAVLHEPNEAPDITPSLVATGRGALVAWNGFDGQTYRVRLAAFEDGAWRELAFAGPAGAVSPALTPRRNGAHLLYRTVSPAGWVVHELGQRGRSLRSAVAAEETTLSPGLAPGPTALPVFEWPGPRLEEPVRVEPRWQAEP